jgi:hypothetical protein
LALLQALIEINIRIVSGTNIAVNISAIKDEKNRLVAL